MLLFFILILLAIWLDNKSATSRSVGTRKMFNGAKGLTFSLAMLSILWECLQYV